MSYPKIPEFNKPKGDLELYSQLMYEYGADKKKIENILSRTEKSMKKAVREIIKLDIDKKLVKNEPNSLANIKKIRPKGVRRIWQTLDVKKYSEKLEGAFLARSAGCTLGAIVENWPIEKMERWAKYIGDKFPPVDYWSASIVPSKVRYGKSEYDDYTRGKMNGVPVDDDMTYTLLGLLIVEDYGLDFSIEDVGRAWVKYLPVACTAEAVALANLKKRVPAKKAADIDNPYCQWIGADIRSDPWGYLAPGWPEKAAEMAYKDAYLSHRRNGIYGEMYFTAAISAAFAVKHPVKALEIGLEEIPKNCALSKDIRWALQVGKKIKNYKQARNAVDKRFKDMSSVHTNNNACLTIFGLMIGGNDVTKVLSETIAMGLDNDCTAATAGSIVGAIVGKKGVPKHWYKKFNNIIYSYMIKRKKFKIDNLMKRFVKQTRKLYSK
jgi:ADP-ribosylglycohydrolase